jgi:hypothetical protein
MSRTASNALRSVLLALLAAAPAFAEDAGTPAPRATPDPVADTLRVAVLEFAHDRPEAKELASALPDLVDAVLASEKGVSLVSRRDLERIQKEQTLDLAGLVADGKGAQVGKLLGAQVLVVGRVAFVGEEILVTAKAIGAETGVVAPIVVRGTAKNPTTRLGDDVGAKLAEILRTRRAELLPSSEPPDAAFKAALRTIADLKIALPRVAIHVTEEHVRAARAPDPAAETALVQGLAKLGYPLAPVQGRVEREWLSAAGEGKASFPAPETLAADVVIVGAGFSEYGGRVGELVSCRARLELRALDARTGAILGVHAGTGAGADLSEHFAGKKALEELGRKAALELGVTVARARAAAAK